MFKVRGIEVGSYVCDALVTEDDDTFIIETFNWSKDNEEVPLEQHDAITEFFVQEIMTIALRSIELHFSGEENVN
jgi:hypothetical protein